MGLLEECVASASIVVRLPQELVDETITHLYYGNKESLSKCSLVSRQWRKWAQKQLFHALNIRLQSDPDLAAFLSFVSDTVHTIESHIRELYLNGDSGRTAEPPPHLSPDAGRLYAVVSLLPNLQVLQLSKVQWEHCSNRYHCTPRTPICLETLTIEEVIFMGSNEVKPTQIVIDDSADSFSELFASFSKIDRLYVQRGQVWPEHWVFDILGGDNIQRFQLPHHLFIRELRLDSPGRRITRRLKQPSFLAGVKTLYITDDHPKSVPITQAIIDDRKSNLSLLNIDFYRFSFSKGYYPYDLSRCTALEQVSVDTSYQDGVGDPFSLMVDTLSTLPPQVLKITICLAVDVFRDSEEQYLGSDMYWERLDTILDKLGNLTAVTLTLEVKRQTSVDNGPRIRGVLEDRLSGVHRRGILSILTPDIPETSTFGKSCLLFFERAMNLICLP